MSIEQNKAIALRLAKEGWGTMPGWEKIWDELVDRDIVQYFCSQSESICGLETNKAFQASLFEGFPKIEQTIESVVAEGDKVVYFHTLKGAHTGTFMGIEPTNNWVKATGFTMVRVANSKIVEMWYETNLLAVMQQLGIIADLK
ncbi:ester cyclase [Candidatus Gracilibacteria bacterium]|nr:ester cyclase [Candidatus Gracilibacteria bacterium]NJM88253.1 ester cyclase [Hydrococcus sp. RU_2_2]NJP18152.1 ester cyclase [Hydrococcus sp. CRU_1_1]